MKVIGVSEKRYYIYVEGVPLIGHIAFGVVDRGTNVIQIRPTTLCPYNCLYCSVDAGPFSRHRLSEFLVSAKDLVRWVRYVCALKGHEVYEGLIDGVGEPPTHPQIVEIVRGLKSLLPRVAMETRGATLTLKLIDMLDEAGLDRLNVSIDTLNEEKGKMLQGVPWYSVGRVMQVVEYALKNTKVDVHITPVWLPGINDRDIEEIIEWGLRVGVGRRHPPFGIQKYEVHKFGRKVPGLRPVSWGEFAKFLERLEAKYGVPLHYRKLDFGIRRSKPLPQLYSKGDRLKVTVLAPGWLKNEVVAVDPEGKTLVTLVGLTWSKELARRTVKAVIVEGANNIYVAFPLNSA